MAHFCLKSTVNSYRLWFYLPSKQDDTPSIWVTLWTYSMKIHVSLIAVAHCVHWCLTQTDSFSHPGGKSCRAETGKQNRTEKSQSLLVSVVSTVSGPVLKRLNVLWSKGEFVVTWELEAGLLHLFFVFGSSFVSERNISSFVLRTFYVPFMFK